jgi:hypothetical protein
MIISMDTLDHIQCSLFTPKEMAPHPPIKKVITRERLNEITRLWKAGDTRGAADRLEDMQLGLESINKRIKTK